MGVDPELAKSNLPPGLILFPGETPEFLAITGAIKLFEATVDGSFTECGGKVGDYFEQIDAVNESIVVITNYRTCFQPLRTPTNLIPSPILSTLASAPLIHIPHLTINNIDHSPIQITISLKFSPSKYLFKFSKPKLTPNTGNFINFRTTATSLCEEFVTILKRFVYPTSMENVFAFKMGEAVLQKNQDKITEIQETKPKVKLSRKLSLEEQIFDDLFGGSSSSDEENDEVEAKGIDENVYRRAHILGWSRGYRIQKEFERMKMNLDSWCIASVNDDFSLSPTYPQDFILPSKILKTASSTELDITQNSFPGLNLNSPISQPPSMFFRNLARFRSRGRFPVICWKKGHHVLMRSGQPMTGFLGSRGLEDELLMREVLRAVNEEQNNISNSFKSSINIQRKKNSAPYGRIPNMSGGHPNAKCVMKICVLDARGYASAFSNGYGGGGYENTENYPPNTTLRFLGLSNIHAISSSHESLLKAISANSTSSNWYSVLESTGWLGHVADLLKAAGGRDGVVGKIVDEDASVLVHCTDGWDRTTQLVSLAQIMLDPYYRTIKGLQILIEKEWIAFGHPFRARGDLPNTLLNSDSRKYNANKYLSTGSGQQPPPLQTTPAPVFLLFLTCLHHLLQQFPAAFEYNAFLLLCLARAGAGNSPFGDFICNSECERDCLRLRERAMSIWSWVRERKQWFRNAGYQRSRKHTSHDDNDCTCNKGGWKKEVLRPDTGARLITLWAEYYFPKDDISIPLLSTPSGIDFVVPSGVNVSPQHYHSYQVGGFPSEYYLVSLFVKRRRRRIAEKVWHIWRSLVFEKKKRRQDQLTLSPDVETSEKLEISQEKDDDMEEMLVGIEEEIDEAERQRLDKMKERNGSRVLLVVKPRAENTIKYKREASVDSISSSSSSDSKSPLSATPIISDSEPSSSDEHHDQKQIILRKGIDQRVNFAARELCDSHLIEWVELSRQCDSSPIITEVSDNITELLMEAQLDNNPSIGGRYHNNNTLEDLLREAQADVNPVFVARSFDIDNTTKMTICVDTHDSNCNHNTICNTFDHIYATTNTKAATTVTNKSLPSSSGRTFLDVSEFATTLESVSKPRHPSSGVNSSARSSMQDLGEFVLVSK
ncbi:hypothetical protein G9A89_012919 [Geosiphon pyriformis]|nr:hypothetical protein G9A89_012919 [Geosiphon pyriformis]